MATDGPDSPARPDDRRALTHVGGRVRLIGDGAFADLLEDAACPPGEDDGRALTHGFHTWPARMHPHTARVLVRAAPAEGAILDPFMGGGTVPVEALRAGRACHGADVNPVALEVAWARTRVWSRERLEALEARAGEVVATARRLRAQAGVPDDLRRREGRWYDPPALAEVWSLAEAIRAEGDPRLGRMLRACLSSLLVKASRQESDTVPRKARKHRWVPKGRVERWFRRRVREVCGRLADLAAEVPEGTPPPRLSVRDARAPLPGRMGPVAMVVTSPPYPGVYDYAEYQDRRYAALGLESRAALRDEMGARRDVKKRGWMSAAWRFEQDLGAAMARWREALRPDGLAALVIGDGEHGEGVIRVMPLLERAAGEAGLGVRAAASQARPVHGPARRAGVKQREEHVVMLGVER
ncbi:MAG: hypothetical protein ACQEXJ_16605 [Myxococcota bacterium]